jgi:tryptophan synthase alpha chain
MLTIFITAGFPDFERSVNALRILDSQKINLIELGVPYSDPLADGPVIQEASYTAIEQGMNLDRLFELIATAKDYAGYDPKAKTGLNNIILFGYYNAFFAYGFETLIDKMKASQVKGLLIPDLPVNEAKKLNSQLAEHGLSLTLLAALTSDEDRLAEIAKLSEPFIYLVSTMGITGSKVDFNQERIKNIISKLKQAAPSTPVGLGFGIDSAAKVAEAYTLGADQAIIGSKALKVLAADETTELNEFKGFIESLQSAKVESLN